MSEPVGRERVLVTIHDAIPGTAFPAIDKLCRALREPGDGMVLMRQIVRSEDAARPVFELFVRGAE